MILPDSKLSWIVLAAVVCSAVQLSFSLPQVAVNAELTKGSETETTIDPVTAGDLEAHLDHTEEPIDIDHNDTRSCFPYFISQDIESLLNQALRMLAKSRNDNRRSWLQLFVHRLESLSTQLRQLPAEHKSRCFHIRERLDSDNVNPHSLASAPEEIQLRFAKRLFLSSQRKRMNAAHYNDRLKKYVPGIISSRQNRNHAEFYTGYRRPDVSHNKPSQSNKTSIAQQSNNNIEESSGNSEISGKLDVDSNISSSTESQYIDDRNQNPSPDANREILYHTYENMPFLPRATRKQMIDPFEHEMMPHISGGRAKDLGTTATEPGKLSSQTFPPILQNPSSNNRVEISKQESSTVAIPPSIKYNHEIYRGSSTQQYDESVAQLHDHELNSVIPADLDDDKTANSDKNTPRTTEMFNDDDLVIQLHSGGKYDVGANQKQNPLLRINKSPIKTKAWPYSTPSESRSESQDAQELQGFIKLERPEKLTMHTRIPNDDDVSDMMVQKDNNAKNMDFDYEEQGAAAGELFIDDDVIPTKYLTAPSSVGSTESYDSHEDDAVRQLDELKSGTFPSHNPNRAEVDNGLAVPMKQDGVQLQNIQPILLDDK